MGGVIIKTPTDLDSLPNLSVVIFKNGTAFQKRVDLSPTQWRAHVAAAVGYSSDALMSYFHPITLVHAPGMDPGSADARSEALCVVRDMLAIELGLSHDIDSIARVIIDALTGDGLIRYSPIPWDSTPDCALRVHGPGTVPAADLDASKEPKDAPTLAEEGPMVLITTEWKE